MERREWRVVKTIPERETSDVELHFDENRKGDALRLPWHRRELLESIAFYANGYPKVAKALNEYKQLASSGKKWRACDFEVYQDGKPIFRVAETYKPHAEVTAEIVRDHQLAACVPTLVEQRDLLTRMLATVIDANYGTSYHHIGDGDGIPEEQAKEIQEWWRAHLQQIQDEYNRKQALTTVEQGHEELAGGGSDD